MRSKTYLVVRSHQSEFPEPITLSKGAPLLVCERYQGPEGWDDWFLCRTPGQQAGWVPAQIIERLAGDAGQALEDYTARELDVQVGEALAGTRSLNGWMWCERAAEGGSGWVPLANLKEKGVLKPVVQEEASGCGIASVANILGKTYAEAKAMANAMGIHAEDRALWSDTGYVRRLLAAAGADVTAGETPFVSWESLPDLALLSIKHHREEGRDFWHWVVFKRLEGEPLVLDSAAYLPANIRRDFSEMQPKWFIEVKLA